MSNLLGDKHLLFIMAEEQKEMQVELAQEETKKVAPVATTSAEADENFDWEAYANDDVIPASEKEELANRYAETLSSVVEKEVVEGTPSKPLPLSFVCGKYSRRRRTSG